MILVAGEALVDLVALPDGRFRAFPGGSPANVAVALSRLGVRTEFLGRLGTGRFARTVREHLAANGVGLRYAVEAAEPASLAVVTVDAAGHPVYDFYVDGTADWAWRPGELPDPLPGDAVALCTGSLALALEPGAAVLTALLRREHERGAVTIVLDPNTRPVRSEPPASALSRFERQVRYADVVKASDEDIALLAQGVDVDSVTPAWLGMGPALVVLTRGAEGASAATAAGVRVDVPARRVDVADTVGAGDAFTAGLVDALGRHDLLGGEARHRLLGCDAASLSDIVDHAARVAALTCARHGADPPTAAEVTASQATLAP